VAALTPQAEIEGDMGDAQMGAQARLMSQALRKLTASIGKSRTILIFINQIRMKIGVYFGNPETTTGGNALKFYSSVRLEVRKTETIEVSKDADAIGNRVRVKVVKNKVAPPFRKIELELLFGKGISAIGSLLDCAVKYNIIEKKGAWYNYGEEKVGQGRDNAREYLEQRPDFAKELDAKLRGIIFSGREAAAGKETPAAKGGASAAPEPKPAAVEAAAQSPGRQTGAAASLASAAADEAAPPGTGGAQSAASSVAEAPPPYDDAPVSPVPQRSPGRPRKAVPPAGPAPDDALF
jgi:recombination protein RecA